MKPAQRRRKGLKGQNELYDILNGDGLDVQTVEASGSVSRETGDIILRYMDKKYAIEVKRQEKLPLSGLEKMKDDCQVLVMRQNRDDWKVYMDLDTLLMLLLNNRS